MARASRSITASASRYLRASSPSASDADRLLAGTRNEARTVERELEHVLVEFVVVLQVALVLAVLDLVERRLGDVDVTALDQLRHLAVEEGQQQRPDVAAVDVRIGHDDDAVVAQLLDLEVVAAHAGADAGAEHGDQGGDLLGRDQLVEARLLDVEHLAAQRQDRLVLAVTALLGRAAGGVTLDDEQLASWRDRVPGSRRACREGRRHPARPCGGSCRAPCGPHRAPGQLRRSCRR